MKPKSPPSAPARRDAGAPAPIMAGHKYDGIREYDNPMPGWWSWTFVATIVFAVVYGLGLHAFGWIDTYEDDLAEAQAELARIREVYASTGPAFKTDPGALRAYAADPAYVQAGAAVFATTCAACHGDAGQGLIGPNLTDAYWLHGNAPEDVYRVISDGVPANGMPAWDGMLSEEEQAQAMAFVLSLQGTDPPNPKEPQGELVE
ncbi:MAG TPA: cbb3-type cytochrome c oxidase N-terminal domain-containing protein [Rubricoccaceae bacterium]|jgi:cytochrome c oxidase cbb3-type subunit 3|nr:cbb3-type cytochrome c oxidase N-terminal domain-containing protein [Rubricoccaceae bacterium]